MDVLVYGSRRTHALGKMCARALCDSRHTVHYFPREYPHPRINQLCGKAGVTKAAVTRFRRNRFVARAERISPDIVLIVKGYELNGETIAAVRSTTRRAVVNWDPDNPYQARSNKRRIRTYLDALSEYDLVCTWGTFLMDRLARDGARELQHLPFAYDPTLHYQMEVHPSYASDVLFVGAWSEKRERVLQHLTEFDTAIYGPGWTNCRHTALRRCVEGGTLSGIAYGRALSSAKIAVNVVGDHNLPAYNMRSFEIPPTGTAMASTYTNGQAEFYEDGRDAILYDSGEDLVDSIQYYLDNPSERKRLARAGRNAVDPHTYAARMETLVERVSSRDAT